MKVFHRFAVFPFSMRMTQNEMEHPLFSQPLSGQHPYGRGLPAQVNKQRVLSSPLHGRNLEK